jgi:hypothetical protein
MNYRETFLTDDLNRILTDRQTAEYLDGVFSVIRSIVGYTTIVNDLAYSEILKDNPDRNRLIDVLNESDGKLSDLLNTITDAHQIVSKTHISDLSGRTIFDLSDETSRVCKKIQSILAGTFVINADIEPYIFSDAMKSDIEILLSDMVKKVIMYEIPPAVINVTLAKKPDGKRAVLTIEGKADGSLPHLPRETETSTLMHTEAIKAIFAEKFCETVGGIGTDVDTDTGLHLSLEMDIIPEWDMGQSLRLHSPVNFDFENKRFSPAALAFKKFASGLTYKLPDQTDQTKPL